MKILIHATWTAMGGIETFTAELMGELSKMHEVFFFVSYAIHGSPELFRIPEKVHVFEVPFLLKSKDKKKIEALLKEINPDVIHLNNTDLIDFTLVKYARKLCIPVIISNHQIPEYGIYKWNGVDNFPKKRKCVTQLFNFFWQRYIAYLDNRATCVIVPSNFFAKRIRTYGVYTPIQVLSCGVDVDFFSPQNIFPKKEKIALYVGRLDFGKRIDVVLRALPEIIKKIPDFHFIICGQDTGAGAMLAQIVKNLHIEKHIDFIGTVPAHSNKLQELYSRADVFVMPSTLETQSIVTLEAMSSGLPIVAADASALPELVRNGENGFLFENENSKDCAEKIVHIFENQELMKKFGEKSRDLSLSHSKKNVALAFSNTYESIVKKK